MDRIILDILHYIGVEHVHPEDLQRIKTRYFTGVKGVRVLVFRAVWPLFFARLLKARQETEYMNEFNTRWE